MMLLVTDFDRRFSVESAEYSGDASLSTRGYGDLSAPAPGDSIPKLLGSHDKLTAREALRAASEAGPGALILVDGHPVQAEQLEALASRDRRVSIACLITTPNPQINSAPAAAKKTTRKTAAG